MASIWTQRARNLPAQPSELAARDALLKEDLEFKALIESRKRALQGRISEAESAAKAISQCIDITDAFRGVYAANCLSANAFQERIEKALKVHSSCSATLAAVPSTSKLLTTWNDILKLTDEVSVLLERAKLQADVHLHLCAGEQIAHESAAEAAKQSLQAIGVGLHSLNSSISQNKRKIHTIRCLPTELLQQIFNLVVEVKQASLDSRLITFPPSPKAYLNDPVAMWKKTINFVPITLSAICKRWRDICESTPSLWRFLRIPTTLHPDVNPWVIGGLPFAHSIANTNGKNLEITLYPSLKVETVTQAISTIPSEHSIAKLIVVESVKIPSTLSSALTVWFIGHSSSPEVKVVDLVPTRLRRIHYILCKERLPLIRNGPLLLQSLQVTLTKGCVFPDLGQLLTGSPLLRFLVLRFFVGITYQESTACTHHSLRTMEITSYSLPILQLSIRDGVSIPAFRHFQVLDVDKTFTYLSADNNATTFALVTHLTIGAVSSSRGSVKIRTLLDIMSALLTLQLKGTAVGPGLNGLCLEPVVRISKVVLHDSDVNCAPLREYLTKLAEEGRVIKDVRPVKVTWKGCPGFLKHYGATSGSISLGPAESAA